MKNRRGLILISLGVLLFLGALGLSVYNFWDERRAEQSVVSVMEGIDEQIPAPGTSVPPAGDFIPDYVLAPKIEMPTVTVDGREYVGYLNIPALDLALPVMSQWSYDGLKVAPCRYFGSAYLDNMVICAHNYVHQFGTLGNLRPDDLVQFVDADGNLFEYVVVELNEIGPYDIQEMNSGEFALSLFTCNFSGRLRTTVRCERL